MAKGLKLENRIRVAQNLQLHTAYAQMGVETRMGAEKGTAGNAEIKISFDDIRATNVRDPDLEKPGVEWEGTPRDSVGRWLRGLSQGGLTVHPCILHISYISFDISCICFQRCIAPEGRA